MTLLTLTDEEREKAGRRPLPKTMRAWMAEIEGLSDFVKQRPRLKDANGVQWLKSMTDYNKARLKLLAENPPGALNKTAARIIVKDVLSLLK